MEHEVTISHLRDCLGVAYLHVVRTGEPVVVQRYGKTDVALVPLWEWRWLKAIEEAIRSGQIDASDFLADGRRVRIRAEHGWMTFPSRGNWCDTPGDWCPVTHPEP